MHVVKAKEYEATGPYHVEWSEQYKMYCVFYGVQCLNEFWTEDKRSEADRMVVNMNQAYQKGRVDIFFDIMRKMKALWDESTH